MDIPLTSTLFKPKNRNSGWFACSLDMHGVYLAKVRFSGAMPVVERCEYHDTGTVSAVLLERLCNKANLGNHVFSTLLRPGEYQMLLIDMPGVPADELKAAVRWKVKDALNYPIDDATVDVLRIPSGKYGSDRVQSMYVIVAANDTIKKRIALFEQAKINLDVIDIPEMAQRNIAALFEQEGRALALLSFSEDGGLLTFTSSGELLLARRFEISVGQLQDANEDLREQHRNRAELELQRSLDYFSRQFSHLTLDRVLVSVPDDTRLVEFLASVSDVKVEKLAISQVMDISAIPALSDSEFSARVLHTLGAALRDESGTP